MTDADDSYIQMPTEVMFSMGWVRFLPPSSIMVFAAVSALGNPTMNEIGLFAGHRDVEGAGAAAAAWDEPYAWTEKALEREHADEPPSHEVARSVDEVNSQARADHADQVAAIDRYAEALALPSVRTLADVVAYMTACQLLTAESGKDGEDRYQLNPDPPLPDEVLPLPRDTRVQEDKLRWETMHEPTAQRIIALFTPDAAERPGSKRTSLQRLARELNTDVETARAGLVSLLVSDDFTATRDPETITEHQVFEIRVDWDLFAADRISVGFDDRDDNEDQR